MRNDDERTEGASGEGWIPEPLVLRRPPARDVFVSVPPTPTPPYSEYLEEEAAAPESIYSDTDSTSTIWPETNDDALLDAELLDAELLDEGPVPADAEITEVLPAVTDVGILPEAASYEFAADSRVDAKRAGSKPAHKAVHVARATGEIASDPVVSTPEPLESGGVSSVPFEVLAAPDAKANGSSSRKASRRAESRSESTTDYVASAPESAAAAPVPQSVAVSPGEAAVAGIEATDTEATDTVVTDTVGPGPSHGAPQGSSSASRRPSVTEALARTEEILERNATAHEGGAPETSDAALASTSTEVGMAAASSERKSRRRTRRGLAKSDDVGASIREREAKAPSLLPGLDDAAPAAPMTRREVRETGEVKRVRPVDGSAAGKVLIGPGEVVTLKKTRRLQRLIDVALVVVFALLILCVAVLVFLIVTGAFDTALGTVPGPEFNAQSTSGSIGDSAAMMNP